MILVKYTRVAASKHVAKVRSLLTRSLAYPSAYALTTSTALSSERYKFLIRPKDEMFNKVAYLKHFFMKKSARIACLNRLAYSGWNPVTGHRALCGDLFYLDVVTLEGCAYVITVSCEGFYVNKSSFECFDCEKYGLRFLFIF